MNNNWQPIETAPKDGKKIIVEMWGVITLARWDSQRYHKHPKPYWRSTEYNSVMRDRDGQPKFWMPLPESPTNHNQ